MRLLEDFYIKGSFSLAELMACVRDGEMSTVDSGFILSDVPDDIWVRARVVGSVVDARCIAASWSAAWVHGAIQEPPVRHTVALRDGLRMRFAPGQRYDIAQMSFDRVDVMGGEGSYVTTPLRTAIDLARFVDGDERLEGALCFLLQTAQAGPGDFHSVLERVRNLPH